MKQVLLALNAEAENHDCHKEAKIKMQWLSLVQIIKCIIMTMHQSMNQ